MKIIKLRIDGQQFYLDQNYDVDDLKQRLLASARGVAEFIDFEPVGHGVVSVLMTPHTPVRFEVEERSEDQLADWSIHPPVSDVSSEQFNDTPDYGDEPRTAE